MPMHRLTSITIGVLLPGLRAPAHEGRGVLRRPLGAVVEQTDGLAGTGQRRTLTTRYIVGADGANSFVRTEMGTPLHDLGFFYDWLIVDLVLHEPRIFDPPAWQLCDPARPTTIVPGGPGRRRWEFMPLPHEDITDLNRLERAWELLEPWDVHPGNATLERHTVYTFQARWAQTWRRGRLMIAGDAAHLMPPFAGRGMCAGLRDAMNLAWKLDLMLRGEADEDVLDTYGPERTPHVRAFVDFSMQLGRLICLTDPDAAAERDRQMMTALAEGAAAPPPAPVLGPGLLREGDPAAGTMSIQAPVTTSSGSGLFDDVVARGCLLLSSTSVTLDAERGRRLGHVGVPVVALGTEPTAGTVVDNTGAYRAWLDELGADAVLVRPDFAVYGTARRRRRRSGRQLPDRAVGRSSGRHARCGAGVERLGALTRPPRRTRCGRGAARPARVRRGRGRAEPKSACGHAAEAA